MVVDGLDLTGSLERDGDGRREEEEDGDFFSTVLSMEMVLLFSIFGVVLFNLSHHYRYPYRMYGWGYSLDVDPAADRIVPSWEAH